MDGRMAGWMGGWVLVGLVGFPGRPLVGPPSSSLGKFGNWGIGNLGEGGYLHSALCFRKVR